MTSWLKRTQAGIQSAPPTPAVASAPISPFVPSHAGRVLDPNAPDARLDVESRCIYERRLPGEAYITAHVTRLQDGFYDTPDTHGDCIENVRFLAVTFVFHPSETGHRFQAATVTIGLHDDTDQAFTDPTPGHKVLKEPRNKPKFLRYAPHVLFGGVSPETLDWNFNLTGSLGVSQTPASASVSPSGGIRGSYKLYQMMRIQGSTRTLLARHHHEYNIEDGEVWWTMEENTLQKSGLPREMTFVMLVTKGDVENVVCEIDIKPKIATWFGHYPGWWNSVVKYRPLPKEHIDLDVEMGQKFEPTVPGRGFNFANLAGTFNDFVSLPGTTYSLSDRAWAGKAAGPDAKTGQDSSNTPKQPSRQDTQQSQPAQPVRSIQPPARPQTVPPPSNIDSSDSPMDYHIYLHNPRTINLHATPPPHPQLSNSPPAMTPVAVQTQPQPYTYQPPVNIIRPRSTAPTVSFNQQRVPSPANTKMKRRSIDISNPKNTPYYDAAKTPVRNSSGQSGQSSSGGSLRRRRSKNNLRHSPVAEEKDTSSSSDTRTFSGASSSSTSRSSRLSLSRSRSLSNPTFSNPIIVEAPSPPDPGVSGFKARLQAHMASERERERDQYRSRASPKSHDTEPLPFEVQPQTYRPPREFTPSPDPTENPNSETTQESLVDDHAVNASNSLTNTPATKVNAKTSRNPNPHLLDVSTNTPTRRERLILTSPPLPPAQPHTPLARSRSSPSPGRPRTQSPSPIPHPYPLSPETLPMNGTPAPKSPLANGISPYKQARSPKIKPTSPPSAGRSLPARILPPYTASKWDGFRTGPNATATSPPPRPRRASSSSLSPDQSHSDINLTTVNNAHGNGEVAVDDDGYRSEEVDEQPIAGDLREEARRRARQRERHMRNSSLKSKRMSLPGNVGSGTSSSTPMFGEIGSGKSGLAEFDGGNGKENVLGGGGMEDRGYEYITAADLDRDWEER